MSYSFFNELTMKKIVLLFLFSAISFTGIGQSYQDYYILGMQKLEQRKYSEAMEQFTLTIDKNAKFEEAYLKRGACYQLLNDYKKAIDDFSKVIEINPKNEYAFYNRGLAHKDLGDYNHAIQDFTESIVINPEMKFAYYNRALVKLRLSDFDNACLDLAKAADLGVENAAEIYKYTCKQ